jgi:6-pyruvoyltetrahydropterin/6-carboxytetrahydropterin synthase
LDHFNQKLPAFQTVNPTSENIARHLYKELARLLNGEAIRISKVKVSETPGAGAFYWEEE